MERKKYLLTGIFLLYISIIWAQSNETIYKAYISGNMNDWKKYIDTYKPMTNEQKLEFINYQYGFIAYCISQNKKDLALNYLLKAESLLREIEKTQYKISMIYAYKSAFIGFKIGISPYKAPFLGDESLKYAQKSIEIDSNNFLGYIQLGNIEFYKPAIFGGSKSNAIKNYEKALYLMEMNTNLTKNNWNYLNLLASITKAYYEIGDYETAKKYAQKTLKIEPNFNWVKNDIYPKILKKIKNETSMYALLAYKKRDE